MFYVSLSFQLGHVRSESNEEYNSSYKSKINTNSFSLHLDEKIKRGLDFNFKKKQKQSRHNVLEMSQHNI